MKPYTHKLFAMSLSLLFLISVEAAAQETSSFEQLRVLVKPGDKVFVTDSSGNTTKGRISDLSNSSLGFTVQGVRRDLSQTEVLEIKQWRHDSVKNGAAIGAGIGLGFGVIAVASACSEARCEGEAFAAIGYVTGIGTVAQPFIFWAATDSSQRYS